MGLNLYFLLFFLSALAISLWLGYLVARVIVGPQTARRNLYYSGPWILLGALLAVGLSFAGRYGLVVLYGLYAIAVLGWLLSWPWRKQRAGALLHRVGQTAQNKVLFWLGLGMAGLALVMTRSIFDQLSGALTTTGGIVSGLVEALFWWAIALMFIALGRSSLEVRKRGLCYLFAWQPWERIEAFGWDDDKPNTLILKVFPRFVFSRRYVTLAIPEGQKDTVDQLIDDYLVEADLATAMDAESGHEA